jgi:hypothetical protein
VGKGNKQNEYGLKTYDNAKLPVWIEDNAYLNCAVNSRKEINMIYEGTFDPSIRLDDKGNEVYLTISFGNAVKDASLKMIDSEKLGAAKIPRAVFENSDGTSFKSNLDYFGNERPADHIIPGPFAAVKEGVNVIRLW